MKVTAVSRIIEACKNNSCGCALQRLADDFEGRPDFDPHRLVRVAQQVGFDVFETYGIMDGWDSIEYPHRNSLWADHSKYTEYTVGRALGVALAQEYLRK